jgi:hypothetical protein
VIVIVGCRFVIVIGRCGFVIVIVGCRFVIVIVRCRLVIGSLLFVLSFAIDPGREFDVSL